MVKRLAPGKTLRDPHDLSGIPTVSRRRGIPRRDAPLPGTRSLSHPKGDLRKLVSGSPFQNLPVSRLARIYGWTALTLAILAIPLFIAGMLLQRSGEEPWTSIGYGMQVWAFAGGLFLINFFGTFSQVLSDSREERGVQGILLYWSSVVILLLINWAM